VLEYSFTSAGTGEPVIETRTITTTEQKILVPGGGVTLKRQKQSNGYSGLTHPTLVNDDIAVTFGDATGDVSVSEQTYTLTFTSATSGDDVLNIAISSDAALRLLSALSLRIEAATNLGGSIAATLRLLSPDGYPIGDHDADLTVGSVVGSGPYIYEVSLEKVLSAAIDITDPLVLVLAITPSDHFSDTDEVKLHLSVLEEGGNDDNVIQVRGRTVEVNLHVDDEVHIPFDNAQDLKVNTDSGTAYLMVVSQ
jgi:hypothetical protein